MPPCPTYLLDVGPNLTQILIQLLTLVGVVYGVARVVANGKATEAIAASPILNGGNPHPPPQH
jgi:hypothetical protein